MGQSGTSPGGDEIGPSGLFVRNATGLIREIGLRDAFIVNLSVLNPGAGLVGILIALTLFPGTDLTWPFVIAAIVVLFLALTYAQLAATLPRTGGDFVYVGRLIHPLLGAMVGGGLFIAFVNTAGVNAIIFAQQYFPFFLQALGRAFGVQTLELLAASITSQTPSFVIACILAVVLGVVGLGGAKAVGRLLFACIVVGMAGFIVAVVEFTIHDHRQFVAAFDAFSKTPDAYAQVIAAAHQKGLVTGVLGSAVIAAVPYAALLYWGFTWSIYPGGEVKRPMNTTRWATVLALALGVVMYLVGWLSLVHLTGLEFLQSASWLSSNDSAAYAGITSAPAVATFYALLMSTDPVSKVIMAIAFPAWSIAIVAAYVLVTSRIIFALSFDRIIPSFFAAVSPRTNAPINAVALTVVGFVVFVALGSYTSFLAVFNNTVILFAIDFTLVSIAAVLLPWRQRGLYEASPKAFPGRWFGLPPVAIIGGLSAVLNGALTYLAITQPQLSGGYTKESIIGLILTWFWGLGAYGISRLYLKRRQGIDISLAMRELPPE